MESEQPWDWDTDLKEIPVGEWEAGFNWVEEYSISPDGERIAGIVNVDEMAFKVCVNGHVWDTEYEKIWGLTSLSNNTFSAFVYGDDEWTLSIDDTEWSNRFDFIWNFQITPDGKHLGIAFQKDAGYGMAVNDQVWDQTYISMSDMALSSSGASAAVVQVESMAGADVDAFKKGLFSIAVNGSQLGKPHLNIWDICFDKTGKTTASSVRLDRESYTISHHDTLWDRTFQAVWKPVFSNAGHVLAPVRDTGKWRLFRDNKPFWKKGYELLWKITPSPANNDIAAIIATTFGKWSVAVNDRPWDISCDTMISEILYSGNGSCLVAVLKNKGVWDLAVNQKLWGLDADKLFTPCISPDGSFVAAVIEKQGRYSLVLNNKTIADNYELMSPPVFKPDLSKILVKGIKNGIYQRRIISI